MGKWISNLKRNHWKFRLLSKKQKHNTNIYTKILKITLVKKCKITNKTETVLFFSYKNKMLEKIWQ